MGTTNNGLLLGLLIGAALLWLFTRQNQPHQVSNEEVWEWTDYRGNVRRAVVHRNVQSN